MHTVWIPHTSSCWSCPLGRRTRTWTGCSSPETGQPLNVSSLNETHTRYNSIVYSGQMCINSCTFCMNVPQTFKMKTLQMFSCTIKTPSAVLVISLLSEAVVPQQLVGWMPKFGQRLWCAAIASGQWGTFWGGGVGAAVRGGRIKALSGAEENVQKALCACKSVVNLLYGG